MLLRKRNFSADIYITHKNRVANLYHQFHLPEPIWLNKQHSSNRSAWQKLEQLRIKWLNFY